MLSRSQAIAFTLPVALMLMGLAAGGCADPEPIACGNGVLEVGESCDDGNDDDTDKCTTQCTFPRCGDGLLQPGEECDDGNGSNNDQCLNACVLARCGDGYRLTDLPEDSELSAEECDDGNSDPNDACLNSCLLARCGDGVLHAGVEVCDDGNDDSTDGCNASCQLGSCGDGILQAGEACDDGNKDETDGCLSSCVEASCGDGFLHKGVEECDDGNFNDGDDCLNACISSKCGDGVVHLGVEACDDGNQIDADSCTNACVLPTCGDGLLQPNEECDDGDKSNQNACLNTCLKARCGDGYLHLETESCDDGNKNPNDDCLNTCDAAICGDGILHVGHEACDDGNGENEDGCTNACALPSCGDGVVQEGEECDDGNKNEADDCSNACLLPACGDGILQQAHGELCDDGNKSTFDACLPDCQPASCGDGFIWAGVEQCDDGNEDNEDGCSNQCTLPSCGNGTVENGEQCDDGNANESDSCLTTCSHAICGDGVVQKGVEACDDGNQDDGDECRNNCTLPTCGDGVLDLPEECDDGNGINTDACTTHCQIAVCGDGYVHEGTETCDDGNLSNSDGCLSDCTPATCGDGEVQVGVEACDDGNNVDTDACLTNCTEPVCGDGIVWEGAEACDDANIDNLDGCLVNCQPFDPCETLTLDQVEPPQACVGSPPDVLTLQGSGFLFVGDVPPTVTLGGVSVEIAAKSGCKPVFGAFNDLSVCSTLEIPVPANLEVGTYVVAVTNQVPEACSVAGNFGLGPIPDIKEVLPDTVCAGPADFVVVADGLLATTTAALGGITPSELSLDGGGSLSLGFDELEPGLYDLTVSNGPGCDDILPDAVEVLTNPSTFFVDPAVLYNDIELLATVYVADINGGGINEVAIRKSKTLGAVTKIPHVYDPALPSQLQATVPKGLAPGLYDVFIEDGLGCTSVAYETMQVVQDLGIYLGQIEPSFGWKDSATDIVLTTEDPPPPGATQFEPGVRLYLSPSDGDGIAVLPRSVGYVSPSELTAVIPAGLEPGNYDVIVASPSGKVGVLKGGFTVLTSPPPLVDSITPGSIPNSSDENVVIRGEFFQPGAAVKLDCKDPSGLRTTLDLAIADLSDTTIQAVVAAGLVAGSVCVVSVTNPDGGEGEFSALGVTNPAENIEAFSPEVDMLYPRRSPATTHGRATRKARFLYAIGGDDLTVHNTVESVTLDRFGALGSWSVQKTVLPTPRTGARAALIGRYIYLVGGNDGNGPLSSVVRAEILSPSLSPSLANVSFSLGEDGITEGLWYYRIAAIMTADDPSNPGGESLPSDPIPISVPKGLKANLQPTLVWKPVPNAASYRIYRTKSPGQPSGTEMLIAQVDAPNTQYTDLGASVDIFKIPRRIGALGEWRELASLNVAREHLALTTARDPEAESVWYLYAALGSGSNGVHPTTYERLTVVIQPDGTQTVSPEWIEDLANPLSSGRSMTAGATVDRVATTRLQNENDSWVYVGSGVTPGGNGIDTSVDAGRVEPGGQLGSWFSVDAISPGRAGYGMVAAANQLFAFGGKDASPGGSCVSAQICGVGLSCNGGAPDPPDLKSWNSTGKSLTVDRYLLGTIVESAHIYILGGETTGGAATPTVESTIW